MRQQNEYNLNMRWEEQLPEIHSKHHHCMLCETQVKSKFKENVKQSKAKIEQQNTTPKTKS